MKFDKNIPTQELLSSKEAAQVVGYTSDYVSRLCRYGKVKGEKVANVWFVEMDSLQAFVKEQQSSQEDYKKELSQQLKTEYKKENDGAQNVFSAKERPASTAHHATRQSVAIVALVIGLFMIAGTAFGDTMPALVARAHVAEAAQSLSNGLANLSRATFAPFAPMTNTSALAAVSVSTSFSSKLFGTISDTFFAAQQRVQLAVNSLANLFTQNSSASLPSLAADSSVSSTTSSQGSPASTSPYVAVSGTSAASSNKVFAQALGSLASASRSTLGINTAVAISNGLTVGGSTSIGGSTNVGGTANISGSGNIRRTLTVGGSSSFGGLLRANGGIDTAGADVNAGAGRILASNIINTIHAGSNIMITGTPQDPIISSTASFGFIGSSNSGTVTSVGASGGSTGLSFSGGPITSSGSFTLSGILGIGSGGTGTSTAGTVGGVEYYNGTSLVNSSNLFFDGTYLGIGTTSPYATLSVAGNGVFTGGNVLASTLTATSSLTIASLNGPLQANNGVVSATSSIGVLYGGTGTTTAPTYGQLLLGNSVGGYDLVATSSLGLGGSAGTVTSVALSAPTGLTVTGSPITTSGTLALSLTSGYNIPLTASTTNWNTAYNEAVSSWTSPLQYSAGVASILQSSASQNGYLSSTDWSTFNAKQAALTFAYPLINAANTISTAFGTTTANSFNQLQTFTNGITANALTIASLNGPLQANNGVVSATSSIGVLYGGTGTTTAPSYGNLLIGNSSGGYNLIATSSLGLAAGISSVDVSGGTTGLTTSGGPITSSGTITFNGTLNVAHGGTGSTTLTGILKGNGTGSLTTALAGTDYAPATSGSSLLYGNGAGGFSSATISSPLTFSAGALGISQSTASTNGYLSSTDWSTFNNKVSSTSLSGGTGISYNSSTGVIANTGLLSLAQTYGTAQTGAITLATTSASFNGLTLGTNITNTAGAFTFTPGLSGTLNNSGLTNSTIALATGSTGTDVNVSGSPASLGGTLTLNLPTASATNRGLLSSTDWSTFNNKVSSSSLSQIFPFTPTTNFGAVANSTSTPIWFTAGLQASSTSNLSSTNFVGNVYIGNATPSSVNSSLVVGPGVGESSHAVDIYTPSYVSYQNVVSLNRTSNTQSDILQFEPAGANSPTNVNWALGMNANTNNFSFSSYDGTTLSEKFSITNTGNVGIGSTTPGSLLSVGSTNGINFSTATSTFNSTGGINLASGCYAVNGTCLSQSSGTVTSVALSAPTGLTVTGSPITTSGTLALALQSGYNIPLTASTTNWNTAYNEAVSSWTSPLQYSAGVASILQSSASQDGYLSSTDWSTFNAKQAALTFAYPLINAANTISTAFGTTTANAFNQLQQFNAGASTTQFTTTDSTYLATAGGNVGIGTTNPVRNLGIVSAAGTSVGINLNSTATGGRSYSFFSTNNSSGLGGGKFGIYDDTALASRIVVDSSGNVGIGTTSPGSILSVQGVANFTAATSTFNSTGGINLATGGCFAVNGTCLVGGGSGGAISGSGASNQVAYFTGAQALASSANLTFNGTNFGLGTTTPWAQLSINPNGVTGPAFAIGSSTATNFVVTNGGLVGIGSTTPGSLLALGTGANFVSISNTATSTFGYGINVNNGCFAVNGVCLSAAGLGGLSSVAVNAPLTGNGTSGSPITIAQANGTTDGYLASTDWSTFNNKQAALTFAYPLVNAANTISTAFGTTTANSFNQLQQFNANASTTQLTTTGSTYLATAGGNVGIGTTNPGSTLDVNGSGNFSGTLSFPGGIGLTPGFHFNAAGSANSYGTNLGLGLDTGFNTVLSIANLSFKILDNATTAWQVTATGNTTQIGTLTVQGTGNSSIAGNLGVGSTTPGSLLSIGSTNGINFSTATSTFNSTGGINLASGCYAVNGTCLTQSSGTVTSVALSAPTGLTVTGSPITTSGTLALSLTSGYNIPLTASTTNWNTAYNEAVSSWTSPLQYSAGVASILQSSASQNGYLSSTDWNTFNAKQAALTFAYPLINAANTISTAFGTTTANAFNQLQTFTNGITANALTLASLNGPLQANNGVVSATSSIGVLYGGTGTSTAPTYGQLLLGNSVGGYNLVATSSLGLASGISSVDASGGTTGFSFTGGPITSSGTLTLSGTLGVSNGGTGTTTGGVTNGVEYYNGTTLTNNANLTFNGTTLTTANDASIHGVTVGLGASSISSNITIGSGALIRNTTGSQNTAIGANDLTFNTTGTSNTATGFNALLFNTTGNNNTANGVAALYNNNSGNYNTALGYQALYSAGPSWSNTAVGYNSGYSALGSYNTFLGTNAGYGDGVSTTTTSLTNATAIGYNAQVTANNSFILGGTGAYGVNVGIGTTSPYATLSVAGSGVFTGSATASFFNATSSVGYQQGGTTLLTASSTGFNTFVGFGVGTSTTSGYQNTFTGYQAGQANTTGIGNVANGYQALFQNTTGSYNIAIGQNSLYANTTGSNNVANGVAALSANTTGYQNIAIGNISLASNTTGYYNSASGYNSLYANTTGVWNTADGYSSLAANTTGSYNTVSGGYAGHANTTGSYNTFLGYNAGYNDGTVSTPSALTNATAIGYNAQVTANNSLILGGTGAYGVNVGIGTTSPATTLSVAGSGYLTGGLGIGVLNTTSGTLQTSGNATIGGNLTTGQATTTNLAITTLANALLSTNASGSVVATTSVGVNYLSGILSIANGGTATSTGGVTNGVEYYNGTTLTNNANLTFNGTTLTTANDASIHGLTVGLGGGSVSSNTAVGNLALTANTTGNYNVANGTYSLYQNTFGSYNTANGSAALYSNTTGGQNTASGYNSLRANTTGTDNVGIGFGAGYTGTGVFQRNTFVGSQTNYGASVGILDTTALGYKAGYSNTGWNSTFLGEQSGYNNTSGNNNIAIGFNALVPSPTASNQLNIGNIIFGTGLAATSSSATVIPTPTGNIGIGTTSPYATLSVAGNGVFTGSATASSFNATSSVGYQQGGTTLLTASSTGFNTFVGFGVGTSTTSGANNTFTGYQAGQANTTGFRNSFVGPLAGYSNTTGAYNNFLGAHAGYSNTTGSSNDFFGDAAGYYNTTGSSNTFVGDSTGLYNTTGNNNVFLGSSAGQANTTGYDNVANGVGALQSNTTGYANIATGYFSLNSNTTGNYNISSGYQALQYNTTGSSNNANGMNSLGNNTTGSNNVANGYQSLFNSNSNFNTALGYQAGYSLTSGSNNIILGANVDAPVATGNQQLNIGNLIYGTGIYSGAGVSSAPVAGANLGIGTTSPYATLSVAGSGVFTGSATASSFNATSSVGYQQGGTTLLTASSTGFNTFVGFSSGVSITSGSSNSTNGYGTLYSNTTGTYNTASGYRALTSNTTGSRNVAIGGDSLLQNTTGNYNVSNGVYSLFNNTFGANNVASGYQALYSNVIGSKNTALGDSVGYSLANGSSNTLLGYNSGYSLTSGSNNIILGANVDAPIATGNQQLNIGNLIYGTGIYSGAGVSSAPVAGAKLGIGTSSPYATLSVAGNGVFTGSATASSFNATSSVGYQQGGTTLLTASSTGFNTFVGFGVGTSTTSGGFNTLIGYQVGQANTTGNYNTANGYQSLYTNTTGGTNTAIGSQSLFSNTTGNSNVALGFQSLYANTLGLSNSAIGYGSLISNTTGNQNTATGDTSLYYNTTGSRNTTSGASSLNSNTTGYDNVANGYQSLYSNTTGIYNATFGYQSGFGITTGSNNIILGANVDAPVATGNQQLNIGNLIYGTGIYSGSGVSSAPVAGGKLGLGTTTPAFLLDLASATAPQIALSDGSATSNQWVFRNAGGNLYIGTSSPSTYATSTLGTLTLSNGTTTANYGFVANNNNIVSDYSSGVTTIANLTTGLLSFPTNGGTVAAFDIPLTSAQAAGTVDSYAFQIGGSQVATVYGENNGAGALQNGRFGIGTTSPATTLSVAGNGYLTGGLGIGVLNTTAGTLQTSGNATIGGNLTTGQATTTNLAITTLANALLSTNASGSVVATTSVGVNYLSGILSIANGGTATSTGGVTNGVEYYNGTTLTNNANLTYNGTTLTTANDASISGLTVGQGAGGFNNTVFGFQTFFSNTSGYMNTAIGTQSLYANTTGTQNTAYGVHALYSNTTGSYNTATGYQALSSNTTGTQNTAYGVHALYSNTTGSYNTATGYQALSSNTTGNYNIGLGNQAGYNVTTGYDNIFLGHDANTGGNAITTGYNNIGLGYNIKFPATTTSNMLNIGNSLFATLVATSTSTSLPTDYSAVRFGIGTSSPWRTLSVNGNSDLGTSALAGLFNATTSVGYQQGGTTLLTASSTGFNTFVGFSSGVSITSGSSNSTNGYGTLYSNTTGTYNTASGYRALTSNTTGSRNVAIGGDSLLQNTTGNYNVSNGVYSLFNNTFGANNVASGYQALYSNVIGSKNTALGDSVGYSLANGSSNTLLGYNSGYSLTSGSNNIILGANVDAPIATGNQQLNIGNLIYGTGIYNGGTVSSAPVAGANLGIGTTSPYATLSVAGNSVFTGSATASSFNATSSTGYQQGGTTLLTASSTGFNTFVGFGVGTSTTSGGYNTFTGYQVGQANTTGNSNTANGYQALYSNTTGTNNVAIGLQSLFKNATGIYNIAIGSFSLEFNTGSYNTATGYNSLANNTTGFNNTANGYQSLITNTTGVNNTALGASSLNFNTTGNRNATIGSQSLYSNTTGNENVAAGYQSLYANTTGQYNTALGTYSLYSNTTGTSSTAIGYQAGVSNTTGYQNTFLGYNAGYTDGTVTTGATLFNATAIGYNAQVTANNSLILGGTGTYGVNVGIGTTSPVSTLTVTGSGCFSKGAGATLLCGTTAGSIYYNVANTGAYDVAENYRASSALPAATLVGLDANNPGFITTATNATSLLGVVSTAPGLVLGGADGATVGQTVAPVALSGRVPVTVSLANGPINAGDRLTLSSTTPGVAVKAVRSGQTIGIALAAYSGPGTGTVNMFVSSQYWFAPSDFSIDPTTGNVGIGLPGQGTTTPNHTLTVSGDVGAIAFVNTSTRSAKDDISYVDATTSDAMFNQLVNLKVATYRYKIENQNDPLRLGFIAEDAQTIAPEVLSPDGKGVDLYKLATFTLSGVQVLAARQADLGARVTSLEERVAKLESGAVSVASGSPITFSSLPAQAGSTLASAFSGFGALIQKGVAQFNTLVFRQLVASTDANGDSSAGSVTIPAGNTVAIVKNALAAPSTKIFITFNSPVTGSWWVSDKVDGSFRVMLSAPQTSDVSFDYLFVQTQGQIATPAADGSFPGTSGSSVSAGPDTVAPTITLLGDNPVHISVGGTFVEPGVQVSDAVDGTDPYITFVNGTQQVVSSSTITTASPTTYIITYKATDAAGNSATALRSVIVGNPDGTVSTGAASGASGGSGSSSSSTPASTSSSTASTTTPIVIATSTPVSTDTTKPVVTLKGSAAMQLNQGDIFTDPGATASDDVDGNLTSKIKETGTVDTKTLGLYTLTYSATDAAGNTGSASRVVSIVAAPAPAAATSTSSSTTTSTASSTSTTSTPQ
ncbi:MAG: immunoglobulin-like domain-containing protein [Minisyncoccota bacterium]